MKKLPFILIFSIIAWLGHSQGGWRPGEMEVKVSITSPDEVQRLGNLKLNGDLYPHAGYALLYLVPDELEMIQADGFRFTIEKPDLNAHYQDFWLHRDQYHSYDEIIQEINQMTMAYSAIFKKINYGTSVEGRELVAVKISDNVHLDENEPEVMFDGGIHGDEIGAAENLIRFAKFLCESYGVDPEITGLINDREIWLYIMVNPDGRVNMVRYNSNGVDLNRDWGYMWNAEGSSPGYYSQVESKALRNCMLENQFVVHTSYHSGIIFLSYPWSYRPDICPDQLHIHALGLVYANSSGYTNLPVQQGYQGMYAINGSTKDSYYGIMGSVGWTMEISTNKQPPATQIQYYYELNEPAMIAMIEHAGYGMKGTVTDAVSGEPVAALIHVGNSYPSYSDPEVGDYHKYLAPGTYSVTATANGYAASSQTVTVYPNAATTANFALQPAFSHHAYRVIACQIPGNNYDDEGTTYAALGAPDGVRYSLGKQGWIILDMGKPVWDGPGSEIRVHEGDSDPEGYSCYASGSPDGPWTFLGSATGTSTFNFTPAGVSQARYLRILDAGNGPAAGDNAGFDLDAVEVMEQPPVIMLSVDCQVDDPSGNGNHRIDPGENCNLVVSLRNLGGLTADSIRLFLNYDSTHVMIDNPEIDLGDLPHGEMIQAGFSLYCDPGAPLDEILMMVLNISANEGAFQQSFPMHHTIGAIIEDWEAGNFNQFDWSSSGDKSWAINFMDPLQGLYSAKSGNIDNSQTSGLQVTLDVIGYDDISFYRKVSSEGGNDFLKFYIDGLLVDQWSGTHPWENVSYNVTPGLHTFKWSYEKNWAISQGLDGAWLDYIVFPSYNTDGTLKALANAFPSAFCGPGQSQLGAYLTGGSGNNSFLWSPETSLNHPGIQFPLASPLESTTYHVEVTDGTQSASSSILVSIHPVPEKPVIHQQGDSLNSSANEGNQWYNSLGLIEGATGQVLYPETEDYYHVIVTTEFGCVSEPAEPVYFLFTDLAEQDDELSFAVYPNPSGSKLFIRSPQSNTPDFQIFISDLSGKTVREGRMAYDSQPWIDLTGIQQGFYFLVIKDNAGSIIYSAKIIKFGEN